MKVSSLANELARYVGHPDLSNDVCNTDSSTGSCCNCACSLTRIGYSMANKLMAHVTKMARGNISSARGMHCCPIILRLYIVKNTCVYTHTLLRNDCIWATVATKWYDTASETFLHKSGALRTADWIFTVWGAGPAVTGRIHDMGQNVYNLLLKQEVAVAPVTSMFSFLSHSSRRSLL
jgi:hypothetical protein